MTESCPHYWMLEAGKVDAIGVCRECGTTKLHRGSQYLDALRDKESVKRGNVRGGETIKQRHIWKAGKPL